MIIIGANSRYHYACVIIIGANSCYHYACVIIIGANSRYHYACVIIVGANSRERIYLAAAHVIPAEMAMPTSSSAKGRFTSSDANHPPATYVFPKRAFGKKNVVYRSCRVEWFQSWPWLHYEEDKDTVLCHVCARADSKGKLSSGTAEPSFVSVIMYCYKYTCIRKIIPGQVYTT